MMNASIGWMSPQINSTATPATPKGHMLRLSPKRVSEVPKRKLISVISSVILLFQMQMKIHCRSLI